MRESHFIDQNEQKWADIESELNSNSKNPEKMSRLFVELTDDLSYSRTYYKNRSVRVYLNQIAQRLFQDIYKNQSIGVSGFIKFWKEDLPLAVYFSRRSFLISFLVFAFAVGVGIFSSIKNPGFCESILGESYVEMTLKNIENGDPMAVYKSGEELDGFLSITQNNIRVAFMSFISGLIAAMGTILVLLYNGVMVGAFQYFFIEYGFFQESFLTIWQHGTLEISSIIISGSAGLTLGRGLLFPGSYSRMQAFRLSGMQALKIMMGVIPVLIMAGFIEGYFTRHTDVPDILRLAVILFSLFFILFYFGWYPRMVAAKFSDKTEEDYHDDVSLQQNKDWDKTVIKTASEVFVYTFSLFSKYLLKLIAATILASLLMLFTVVFVDTDLIDDMKLLTIKNFCFGLVANFVCMALALLVIDSGLKSDRLNYKILLKRNSLISLLVMASLFTVILHIDEVWAILLGLIFLPIIYLVVFVSDQENIPVYTAIGKTFKYMKGSVERLIGVWIRIIVIGAFSALAVNYLIIEIVASGLSSMIDFADLEINITYYLSYFFNYLWVFFTIVLMGFSIGALTDTLRETVTAYFLRAKIQKIGQKKKLMGLNLETQDV